MNRSSRPHESSLALGLRNVGPGWYTSVMGTGILGICAEIAPVQVPALHAVALVLFALDTVLFAAFSALWMIQIARSREGLRESLRDCAKSQTWGAPPMACFTISVGFLKIGVAVISVALCTAIAQNLWLAGVALSLFSAFYVPYQMFTQHELTTDRAYGSWLLPVVPPIVASVPAALLTSSWPVALRGTMLGGAYALLGLGVALAAIIIVVFYTRLLFHKLPEAALVPTMWIVVGPLGQSVAGIVALGAVSATVWPQLGHGLLVVGIAYGMMVWGFGVYWLSMALTVTVRAACRHLPFTLGWWAFTFPVGTLTSGSFGLYAVTSAPLFAAVGIALLGLLATMWVLVSIRSVRASLAAVAAARGGRSEPVKVAA